MQAFIAKTKRYGLVVVAGVLLLGLLAGLNMQPSSTAEAQANRNRGSSDYFLKIDGIEGESTDDRHRGAIEIESYAWAKDEPGLRHITATGGGGGGPLPTGKVEAKEIHFSQQASKASPKLMEAVANGQHFKEAVLTVRRAGGRQQQDYMIVKMTDVLVSSYRTTGQDQSVPNDEFTLSFAAIEFSYAPQNADGSLGSPVVGGWDSRDR